MSEIFTINNTLTEVLNQAGKEMCLFFSPALLAFIPEEYRNIPLSDWANDFRMPWGIPFPVTELLHDANMVKQADQMWNWVPLWEKGELTFDSHDIHSVGLMIPCGQPEGRCPAAVICPGGAYESIAFSNEGLFTSKRLQEAGYRTFILNYRYAPNRYPVPQMDLALAIKHIRANAETYQIDPDDLMIIGYSAGGHLCASTTALWKEIDQNLSEALEELRPDLSSEYRNISVRPNKVCLSYPVISFLSEQHEPSFQNLTGGNEALREHLSIEKQIGEDYPKTFLWTCLDDSLVPASNTIRMGQALEEKNVPHLLKVYPQGEHGCATGEGTSAENWIDEMLAFME